MITVQLTDNTATLELPSFSPPLMTRTIEGAQDIETLDNNVSTYFRANKRQWEQSWDYLSEDDFNALKAFYDRQWTEFQYPLLTISHFSITDVPVRMYLSPQNTIDGCGTVQGVQAIFRETRQI